MRLYLIGVGPGDPELLTLKAVRLLRELPVLFYPLEEGREPLALNIARPHIPQGKPLLPVPLFTGGDRERAEVARREAARRIREALAWYREGGYLVLGDSLLYASPFHLLPLLEGIRVEVVPGISAHQLAAARLSRPLAMGEEGFAVLSGLKPPEDPEGLARFRTLLFYKAKRAKEIAALFPNREAHVFRRLAMPGERQLSPEEVEGWDYWTLLLVR
ncbi:precorrin-2 C(20)-methyltransferase [Thermus tengchongensis]|uniref:Precorrin-2 methylase n=2 Tax=Thermus tengchongensis TaxID=1214928 RepID=A0A4Y9F7C6_9DEIN|nr:precorrin-2 C(20)-methyltransferase [Thermus tengchongensis]TFU14282.1 precorrin-2 methylase [Thermus tengchongensis]TFU25064.1 precorrin-2 methylase [Thermus tengchongensis]